MAALERHWMARLRRDMVLIDPLTVNYYRLYVASKEQVFIIFSVLFWLGGEARFQVSWQRALKFHIPVPLLGIGSCHAKHQSRLSTLHLLSRIEKSPTALESKEYYYNPFVSQGSLLSSCQNKMHKMYRRDTCIGNRLAWIGNFLGLKILFSILPPSSLLQVRIVRTS